MITLTSFISAGTPAMLRSEVNDINANIAATLVCNKYFPCIPINILESRNQNVHKQEN